MTSRGSTEAGRWSGRGRLPAARYCYVQLFSQPWSRADGRRARRARSSAAALARCPDRISATISVSSNTSRCAHGCRRCAAHRRAPLPGYPPPPALLRAAMSRWPRTRQARLLLAAASRRPPDPANPSAGGGREAVGFEPCATGLDDARFGVDCRRSLCHSPRRDRARLKTFRPRPGNGEVRTKSERVSRSKVAKVDARSFRSLSRSDTQAGPTRPCPPDGYDVSWTGAFRNAMEWRERSGQGRRRSHECPPASGRRRAPASNPRPRPWWCRTASCRRLRRRNVRRRH